MTVGSASYKVSIPMVVQDAQLLPKEYGTLIQYVLLFG
jgi:hypothetical protein